MEKPGLLVLGIYGNTRFFQEESGGHRWQRIPPTEKRGRIQTSTVTVAVLDSIQAGLEPFDERKVEWEFFCSGGPGGQNQNKRASGARGTFLGIICESREGRDQSTNRKIVLRKLRRIYLDLHKSEAVKQENSSRRKKIGSGQRGDKIRTYREQDDSVRDLLSGKSCLLSKIRKGDWSAFSKPGYIFSILGR